jgi:NADPH-dependent glutamate synthase beta subunit-like oxidoreductase/Pyruvate/2-oxoacid:ferredoxin oxidoreductase delta subunit
MNEQKITIKDIEPLLPYSRGTTEIFLTGHWSSKKPRWVERTSPCRQVCPIGNDIARAFSTASGGDLDGALNLIREENPLPGVCGRVCYHPCEGDCNRRDLDQAINIRGFERYLADHGQPIVDVPPRKDKKVAIVGSGPAGLSAAYHLARSGYPVTIFEALPEPGGMLMYGIPSYRLPRDVLKREIDFIVQLGVEIKTGVRVGTDVSLADIRKTHDALFLGLGSHKGTSMDGAVDGIQFLRRVNSGEKITLGEKVAIIGGGNTAVDCARVARRLGAKEITLVYRRSRTEMPALAEDVELAEKEGVRIEFLTSPVAIEQGKIRCIRMDLGAPDETNRRQPIARVGSEFSLPMDTVIAAVGQAPDSAFVAEIGATLSDSGIIDVRSSTETAIRGVFAGGDCTGTKAYVADAIASGKKAALAILCYLEGKDEAYEYEKRRIGTKSSFSLGSAESIELKDIVTSDKLNTICFPYVDRTDNPSSVDAGPESFTETTRGLDSAEIEKEMARCFKCGTCTECDLCFLLCPDVSVTKADKGYSVSADYCKGCGVCASTCPRHAISMGGNL